MSLFEYGSQPFIELREKIRLAAMQQVTEANLEGCWFFTLAFDRTVRNRFVESLLEDTGDCQARAGETVHFVKFTCIREGEECLLQTQNITALISYAQDTETRLVAISR